ncbi:MAG: Fic family protein [Calditrichaeota bacterium]|nr:MAG: Fic family protein [Calditrichota bacterium]MBL1207670.1 Fic family protein [Calditrichota bacterium]NOG47503.1 Fic family protein [Calditrichota bacterium]
MKPFIPEMLPPENLNFKRLIRIAGEANAALARYDGLLQAVVNPEILLSPLTTNEAVLSSKIEGTQATMDEVLHHEAGIRINEESKKLDIQEIANYRSMLIHAEKEMAGRPLNLFLIRQMHKELMSGVRGSKSEPGKFRDRQNWIGRPGLPIEQATYIPPEPHQLQVCLNDLEKYIKSDDGDVLVQSAIIHAQFEIIHPFLDGNGRIGRLLIPLFLFFKKRLKRPMFYLSEYLENNRSEYYLHLKNISSQGDWNSWIEFYLKAIKQQGKRNGERIEHTLDLYKTTTKRIREIARTQYNIEITDALFHKPMFSSSDIQTRTKIAKQTLTPILKLLTEAGILTIIKKAKGRSPAVMKFEKLLSITEK